MQLPELAVLRLAVVCPPSAALFQRLASSRWRNLSALGDMVLEWSDLGERDEVRPLTNGDLFLAPAILWWVANSVGPSLLGRGARSPCWQCDGNLVLRVSRMPGMLSTAAVGGPHLRQPADGGRGGVSSFSRSGTGWNGCGWSAVTPLGCPTRLCSAPCPSRGFAVSAS